MARDSRPNFSCYSTTGHERTEPQGSGMDTEESQRWVCSSQTQEIELPSTLLPPVPLAVRTPTRRIAEVVPTSRSCEREPRLPVSASMLGGNSGSEASSSPTARTRARVLTRRKHQPGDEDVIPTSQDEQEGEITPESIAIIAARCAALGFRFVLHSLRNWYSD